MVSLKIIIRFKKKLNRCRFLRGLEISNCIKGLKHGLQGVAEFDVWGVKIRPRRLQHRRKEQRY